MDGDSLSLPVAVDVQLLRSLEEYGPCKLAAEADEEKQYRRRGDGPLSPWNRFRLLFMSDLI